ncbi:MAG: DJ-1/PfpI family protein, partial [Gammaproteobacteria bacterium]|nr:DJ-1/PfpI family protein [Gammaproteobacteria bacterium]
MPDSSTSQQKRTIGAVLFPDFELLDIFGPLEMLGALPDYFEIVTLAEQAGPVASAQGPKTVIDR